MKTSEIKIKVELDQNRMPQKIEWDADDKPQDQDGVTEDTRAFSLSLWDFNQKSTLRMDLWTQEMPVDEMKRMVVDTISGLAQTISNATGDQVMSAEMDQLANKLLEHIHREHGSQQK